MGISMDEYNEIMAAIPNFTDAQKERVAAAYKTGGFISARNEILQIIRERNTAEEQMVI